MGGVEPSNLTVPTPIYPVSKVLIPLLDNIIAFVRPKLILDWVRTGGLPTLFAMYIESE